MNNQQIIETLVKKLTAKITWRIETFDETYAEAKAKVSETSVAGPAVWSILDAKFN